MLKNLLEESRKRYDKLFYKDNTREKQIDNSYIHLEKVSKELEYTLYVCNKISKIPFFNIYFQLIYNNKQLTFISNSNNSNTSNKKNNNNEDISFEYMKKIESDTSNKYALINTDLKLTNSAFLYSYDEYFSLLLCSSNKKEICKKIFDIILFVLNTLYILQRHNLYLLNFSKNNLCFNQIEIPFIQNFKYCIEKTDANITNKLYNKNTNGPLELYVINYLENNSYIQSLSNQQIEIISKNYIENHSILNLIQSNERMEYYEESVKYLQPLINMSILDSIKFMLKYIHTWDNYDFHIFLINQIIFKDIIILQVKTNNNYFWDGLKNLLLKNILCNPDKRHNIQQTKKLITEYFYKNTKYLHI
jgi:hypothetical protein